MKRKEQYDNRGAAEMKRNRAECPSISRAPTDAPAKARRPQKEASPKAAARARTATATATEKLRRGLKEEENRPGPAAAAGAECLPLSEAAAVEAAGDAMLDVGAAEFGGWGWWGAEEEKLLGWFPFAAEHFLGCGNGGGCGAFWGGEEEEEYRDIWQLQHIHEIPNTAK